MLWGCVQNITKYTELRTVRYHVCKSHYIHIKYTNIRDPCITYRILKQLLFEMYLWAFK